MTMRLPLERNAYTTIISVYALTITNSEESKEGFYSQLTEVLSPVFRKDKLILTGDFNARVRCEKINGKVLLVHKRWESATLIESCY